MSTTGDADFDAALATAAEQTTPAASTEPPVPEPTTATDPAPPPAAEPVPDFTFATLENGTREARLATGQVYRGKDDAELMSNIAKAQVEASRHITTLNGKVKELTPAPVEPPPAQAAPDATAMAIADLLAPAFGVKNGQELIQKWSETQSVSQQQQEFIEAQRANAEAATFFRNVPEFSKTQADADKIDSFLQSNNLPFTAQTAEMAYHTLRAKGEFAAPAAPVGTRTNTMPPPPAGTSPATTGKGSPSEADLWSMTPEQLLEVVAANTPA